MIHRLEDSGAFALTAGECPPSEFHVIGVHGREALNSLYHFDVTFVALTARATEPAIGAPVRLALRSEESTRFVYGIVSRVSSLGIRPPGDRGAFAGVGAQPFHRVRIVPRVALLPLRKTSRIFQNQSVPAIVQSIAGEIGAHVETRLRRDYQKREYCVQYQETDFEFVRRLLAEEGLFFLFSHGAPENEHAPAAEGGREVLVVADAPSHYASVDGEPTIPLRERGALLHEECIFDFTPQRRIEAGGVLVRGFDYQRPTFVPHAEARTESSPQGSLQFDEGALRAYDHDRVLDPKLVPQHVADLRLDELRAGAERARGTSTARRLVPGSVFELTGHTASELNGKYVVTQVIHDGKQGGSISEGSGASAGDAPVTYENRFRCAPARVAVRAKRSERRLLQVTETALVVGPPGEEIHTDELGRVKVQFHWDLQGRRDDASSCWIRVMQPWAGPSWGSQFFPRVGMEVVVSFIGGDPDRPMVMGSAYNGVTPPPFALPAAKTMSGIKTRSTPGGGGSNQLSFEDQAGHEQVYLHAERDFDEVVGHDHTRTVRGHESIKVEENRIVEVEEDNVRIVRGSETLIVEKNFIMHVAGQQLIHIGSPPDEAPKDELDATLPDDAPAWAKFQELAKKPIFDDATAARASRVRRSKIMWHADELEGEAHRAGQFLLGRVADLDTKLDALGGEAHLLTEDIQGLSNALRASPIAPPSIATLATRAEDLRERAKDLELRMAATVEENIDMVPAIAALQQAVVEHVAEKRERTRALTERFASYATMLADAKGFIAGSRRGGGGGTTGQFTPANVSFSNYLGADGKSAGAPPTGNLGSSLNITGGGEIVSDQGFKIRCGSSVIEMTPGSISIHTSGPIKLNGSLVLLNCP